MSNERSNHKPQDAVRIAKNKRLKAERHIKHMMGHENKRVFLTDGSEVDLRATPRGTARRLRRQAAGLTALYNKRQAAGNITA